MAEYTTINVTEETKQEFDKQRTLPEGKVSAEEFLQYLLKQNNNKR